MKTARFQSVIDAAGTPEQHLLWAAPAKDKALQKALKEQRVMTVHQTAVGTKADYGTVGLAKAAQGQILIFPHSLADFEGKRIVGVNYDLYADAPVKAPAAKRAKKKAPAKKSKVPKETATAKILPFPKDEPKPDEEPEDDLTEIRKKIRQALRALEQGKQVAAYETLKSLPP